MAAYQHVKVSIEDRTAILTIDHPRANTLSTQALLDLEGAFDEASRDPTVKTIIITGAGQLFVAGADISELAALQTPEEARAFARRGQALLDRIEGSPKPIIAAINGRACLGGGNELAMACHIRIAEESVRFGQPEINLGIMPGWGGTQRLVRCVGRGRALEMILGGDTIDAEEARHIGLVNSVVAAGEAVRAARELAAKLNAKGALALAAAIRAVNRGLQAGPEAGLDLEAAEFSRLFATEDRREGTRAFLEKRQARFQDR